MGSRERIPVLLCFALCMQLLAYPVTCVYLKPQALKPLPSVFSPSSQLKRVSQWLGVVLSSLLGQKRNTSTPSWEKPVATEKKFQIFIYLFIYLFAKIEIRILHVSTAISETIPGRYHQDINKSFFSFFFFFLFLILNANK